MRGRYEHPIPLDFAPILSVSHMPLLRDSPLSELAELLKHHDRRQLEAGLDVVRLIKKGLSTTTAHLSNDCMELHAFKQNWDLGVYFPTGSGLRSLASRASTMNSEARKYLEVASTMKRAKFAGSEEGMSDDNLASMVALSTLGLSADLLKQLRVRDHGDL